MATLAENLILVPFGTSMEKRTTSRYQWENRERGRDPFVIFQYSHRGTGEVRWAGRAHPVPAGHAFIAMVPEESGYGYPQGETEPWIFSWINFYGDLGLQLWGGLRERVGPVVTLAPPAARMLESLIARVRRRAWSDSYEASEAGYRFYLEVLRHLRPPRRTGSAPLERSIAHLRSHHQEALRVKEVAALAGMSREHFTRLFLKQTGQGPAAFLRQVRVESAARLLRTTSLPVAEIAFRSGFASATKLGTFFRRRYRLSPSGYRKSFESRRARPPC